jgi:hypothetical protein
VVAWEQCRAKHCAACQKKQRALLGASSAWLEHVSNKVVCCWDANVCRLLLQAGCRCEVLKFSCCCWLEIHAACWCKKTGQQGLGVVLTILVIAILVIAILVIAYKHTTGTQRMRSRCRAVLATGAGTSSTCDCRTLRSCPPWPRQLFITSEHLRGP